MAICIKVFGLYLMLIKFSSCSNLITHMFVISLHAVHFITPFINRPSTCCFISIQVLYLFKLYSLGKIDNFIQSDCFCRYKTVTVVPSLSLSIMTISLLRFRVGWVPKSRAGSEIWIKYNKWGVGISV